MKRNVKMMKAKKDIIKKKRKKEKTNKETKIEGDKMIRRECVGWFERMCDGFKWSIKDNNTNDLYLLYVFVSLLERNDETTRTSTKQSIAQSNK